MITFKKIASVLSSAAMLTSTVALAAAANYPAPFVQGGTADVALVWGTNAANTDVAGVTTITNNLNSYIIGGGSDGSGGGTSIEGKAASLASGSDLLYLNDALNANVQTITKDDLPNVLADGTFTDDDGSKFKYEQTIAVGSGATFAFENSDNDLDDPALLLDLPTTTNSGIYTLTVTFDKAVNFTNSDSEGEQIVLFGKTYIVGTATDSEALVLLGGSDSTTIKIGETVDIKVGEETFNVRLDGITSDNKATIIINGESKTFTEGQTKSYFGGDVDVFVKTVALYSQDSQNGYVEIQLGADKLTFEDGSEVKEGSDDDEIDGTKVSITGGTGAMTKMQITVAAKDNDENHVLVGESFMDPVFGSVKVKFHSVTNGPELNGRNDVSKTRGMLSIEKGGNRELLIKATDASGNTKTIPFTFQNETKDDNNKAIELWEGGTIAEDEYFILNSGNNQHFMQMTDLTLTAGGASTDDVSFKDLFTGVTYSKDNMNFSGNGQDITISGQTYTIKQVSATEVTVTSSDYATNVAVFPYLELVNGEDHRFAITDKVQVFNGVNATNGNKTVELPTGSVAVTFADSSTLDCIVTYAVTDGSSYTTNTNTTAGTTTEGILVGSTDYVVNSVDSNGGNGACNAVNVTFALEATQAVDGTTAYDAPALLFVEDEDKSGATTKKNAVILKTTDSGTYSTVLEPVFTGDSDSESFDDSDYKGFITNFGTYVLFDSSDNNQDFASLTYPKTQMYANVYVAEESASFTDGTGGSGRSGSTNIVVIPDSEIASVSSKNLIVVGGSCVNRVASDLLGSASPLCGSDFTAKTGVGANQFLIETFSRSEGKVATLVAGYNAGDTTNAVKYLTTQTVDTSVGKKYIGTSATEAQLVTS